MLPRHRCVIRTVDMVPSPSFCSEHITKDSKSSGHSTSIFGGGCFHNSSSSSTFAYCYPCSLLFKRYLPPLCHLNGWSGNFSSVSLPEYYTNDGNPSRLKLIYVAPSPRRLLHWWQSEAILVPLMELASSLACGCPHGHSWLLLSASTKMYYWDYHGHFLPWVTLFSVFYFIFHGRIT